MSHDLSTLELIGTRCKFRARDSLDGPAEAVLDGARMGVFDRRKDGSRTCSGLFVVTWFAPLDLEPRAQHLAAVFAAVIVAWVTEVMPISVTALLIGPAMIATGVTDSRTAFAPYADPLIFLFIGGFFIARAMTRHGLDRRMARSLMTFRLVRGSPVRIRMAFMLTAVVLSMWISNTATAAILIPILLGTLPDEDEHAPGSVLAIAYAASVGGHGDADRHAAELHHRTLFLQEQADVSFDFVQWMGVGVPAALGARGRDRARSAVVGPAASRRRPNVTMVAAPWSRGEVVTAICFGLAVAGWTLPGIMRAVGAPLRGRSRRALPIGAVAIFAAAPLFFIQDADGKTPVLPWHDAARIDWGLILLFGGGLSLGAQMFDTGLAAAIGGWFLERNGDHVALGSHGSADRLHRVLHRSVLQHRLVEHDRSARDRRSDRARRLAASTCARRRARRELCVHASDRNGAERRRVRNWLA